MSVYLKDGRGFPLRSHDILALFGLKPSSPIPADYMARMAIGGVQVAIVPRGTAAIKRRVLAECPSCGRWVCAGHLDQHLRRHRR